MMYMMVIVRQLIRITKWCNCMLIVSKFLLVTLQYYIGDKDGIPPTTTHVIRIFLGIATCCAKFIPHFSDVSESLHKLTEKDQPFLWDKEQERSFHTIKNLLTRTDVMAYFDPNKETGLVTDASPLGLSAILIQTTIGMNDRQVDAYASQAITDAERWYSQIEREALAVVRAIEKLHIYLFGSHFKLLIHCKAHAKGKVWKKHLHKFLINYQTTLHCTTGITPA